MKEILVLRHAEKDANGNLTEEGKGRASDFRKQLGHFDLIYSSDKPRAVETAMLLTGNQPIIDVRASALPFSPEEIRSTHEQGALHAFGIAGALFDSDTYRPKIVEKGKALVGLIQEALNKLADNGRALIISHDGVMVAADMILRGKEPLKAEKTFSPLQGFRVFENLSVEDVLLTINNE
ncbi:MAG TPA: histidine phosphatase family protein [Patescibacteria group bacterium]|nr:histidine phosphatase family protein [Patescibacteria group bacterium]